MDRYNYSTGNYQPTIAELRATVTRLQDAGADIALSEWGRATSVQLVSKDGGREYSPRVSKRVGAWLLEAFERAYNMGRESSTDKSQDKATLTEIIQARNMYQDDDVNIDDDAVADRTIQGVWVQAWVWLGNDDQDDDENRELCPHCEHSIGPGEDDEQRECPACGRAIA